MNHKKALGFQGKSYSVFFRYLFENQLLACSWALVKAECLPNKLSMCHVTPIDHHELSCLNHNFGRGQ